MASNPSSGGQGSSPLGRAGLGHCCPTWRFEMRCSQAGRPPHCPRGHSTASPTGRVARRGGLPIEKGRPGDSETLDKCQYGQYCLSKIVPPWLCDFVAAQNCTAYIHNNSARAEHAEAAHKAHIHKQLRIRTASRVGESPCSADNHLFQLHPLHPVIQLPLALPPRASPPGGSGVYRVTPTMGTCGSWGRAQRGRGGGGRKASEGSPWTQVNAKG